MRYLILLLMGILFSQSSVLSFNGLGENQIYQNPENAGSGQIRLFSTFDIFVSTLFW